MIPVDWVARQIVHISSKQIEKSLKLKYFNIINQKENCITIETLVEYINSTGYSIKMVKFEEWKELINSFKNEKENVLFPLVSKFQGSSFPFKPQDFSFGNDNTRSLQEAPAPFITKKIVTNWVKKKKKFI